MIEYAAPGQLDALKVIWMDCFGDDKAYTDFIFEQLLRTERMLTYTDGEGEPLALLCIQPFVLATQRIDLPGAYLFGVATAPAFQGRGLSTALLTEANARLAGEGYALSALVPASESLSEFYAKRGYTPAFALQKRTLLASELPAAPDTCVLRPARLEELADLRDRHYADRALFVRWDNEYLGYIGKECSMLGGEVLAVHIAGAVPAQGYAVCYRAGDTVLVKELALPDAAMPAALAALHARFAAARYTLYLPADAAPTFGNAADANKVLPFAMVQWYDKENRSLLQAAGGQAPWLAHALD